MKRSQPTRLSATGDPAEIVAKLPAKSHADLIARLAPGHEECTRDEAELYRRSSTDPGPFSQRCLARWPGASASTHAETV